MRWRNGRAIGLWMGLAAATTACGSSAPGTDTGGGGSGASTGVGTSSGGSGGSGEGSGGVGGGEGTGSVSSGSAPSGSVGGTGASSGASGGGSSGSGGTGSGATSGASSGASSGAASGSSSGASSGAPAPCVKGQVANNEVVMLGDSYMDVGNVGPTIMKDANNAMYRHYYLAASALNYESGNFNIPYQFDTEALMDAAVQNPKDIKVVIMDGGGNDVLINNSQCLTIPPANDTGNMCHSAIDASVARGLKLEQDIASHNVQHIVYYFYPHLDATVVGHQDANDWLDYSYPKGAAACCGSGNVPASGDLSCRGTGPGIDCVWIDTRPEFVGHNDHTNPSAYWFQSDNIHPTQPGADAISAKVWAAMQKYCIAQ